MKTLHLTLKKKWFLLILKKIKLEEYREIKWYWIRRLTTIGNFPPSARLEVEMALQNGDHESALKTCMAEFQKYDYICFKLGYSSNAPTMVVKFNGISIGEARPEWSDNWKGNVFRLHLGNITITKNCINLLNEAN